MTLFRTCAVASVFSAAVCSALGAVPGAGGVPAPVRKDREAPVGMPQVTNQAMQKVKTMQRVKVPLYAGYRGNKEDEDCAGLSYDVPKDGLVHFQVDVTLLDVDRVFDWLAMDLGATKLTLNTWRWRGLERQPFGFEALLDNFAGRSQNYLFTEDYIYDVAEGATYTVEVLKNATNFCLKAHVLHSTLLCAPLPAELVNEPAAGSYFVELPRNPAVKAHCSSFKELNHDVLVYYEDVGFHPHGYQGHPIYALVQHPKEVAHDLLKVNEPGSIHFKVVVEVQSLESRHGLFDPFLWVNFDKIGVAVYPLPFRGFNRVPGGFEVELDAWALDPSASSGADHFFKLQCGSTYEIEVKKNGAQICITASSAEGTITNDVPKCGTSDKIKDQPQVGDYPIWFPNNPGVFVIPHSFTNL